MSDEIISDGLPEGWTFHTIHHGDFVTYEVRTDRRFLIMSSTWNRAWTSTSPITSGRTAPMSEEMNVTFGRPEHIDDPRQLTWNELLDRAGEWVIPGHHLWTLSLVYRIVDPEAAMDDMVLGAENFIGPGRMLCLLCGWEYRAGRKDSACIRP